MGIYKSQDGKEESLALYDKQLLKLNMPFSDIYVKTSFGKTHLVETGNKAGKPLLVFHGGNATTAYNLLMCQFLLNDFHIYAVDTIGHPGKSDEVCLSHKGYEYGKWASEVIDKIGYDSIASEKDCLFPARKVLHRAGKMISDCQLVELKESGHSLSGL